MVKKLGHWISEGAAIAFFIMIMSGCQTNNIEISNTTISETIFEWVEIGRIATDAGQSRGVAWGDFNSDGYPDLYVSNAGGQWNALYKNIGNGTFKKITDSGVNKLAESVIHGGNSQGASWIDYDNDGDLDLFVVSRDEEQNLLFRNDDKTSFTRITDNALTEPGISASMACWADIEGDGDLDVFLSGYNTENYLFRNIGNGQFQKVEDSLLTGFKQGNSRACGCGDSNNDGLPEFYIANPRRPNYYFINKGNWNFLNVKDGHAVTDVAYSYGVSWADYDDDGDLDLFVANFDKQNVLYNNNGDGILTPITIGNIVEEQSGASKGHAWGDYDNDGDLDLFIANGTYRPDMQNFLYLNNGLGSFSRHHEELLTTHSDTSAGVAHADFDGDGDLDLFVANWGGSDEVNRFYKNNTEGQNWLTIRLRGHASNSYGIGAKIALYTSEASNMKNQYRWLYPSTGYGSQNDYKMHFGLGNQIRVDSMKIYWPSNVIDTHKNLVVNQHYVAFEGGKFTSEL